MPKADTCDLVIKSVHQMAPKTFQFHWMTLVQVMVMG